MRFKRSSKELESFLFQDSGGLQARGTSKIFLHSCGAIRPVLPNLIEVGG